MLDVAHERLAGQQPIPGAVHDAVVRLCSGGLGSRQGNDFLLELRVSLPGLTQEDLVHDVGGADQVLEGHAVAIGEVPGVGG